MQKIQIRPYCPGWWFQHTWYWDSKSWSSKQFPMRAAFVSLDTHALAQIHKQPTREGNIFNLMITKKPGLIKSSHSVPLPGISDHRTEPRLVCQFKNANWEAIRQTLGAAGPPFQKRINARPNLYQLKWISLWKIYLAIQTTPRIHSEKHLYI